MSDPVILAMSERIRLIEAPDIEACFPAERFARARFVMKDGSVLESRTTPARGDAEHPLRDDEINSKFHAVSDRLIGVDRARVLEETVMSLSEATDIGRLLALILHPIGAAQPGSLIA